MSLEYDLGSIKCLNFGDSPLPQTTVEYQNPQPLNTPHASAKTRRSLEIHIRRPIVLLVRPVRANLCPRDDRQEVRFVLVQIAGHAQVQRSCLNLDVFDPWSAAQGASNS
jgi:hypothetical protein